MKLKIILLSFLFFTGSFSYPLSKSIKSADTIRPGEPVIGKTIPLTKLDAYYNGEITTIDLNNYKGKWIILFFYPADFTTVCPTELKEMSDYYQDFKNEGCEVFCISTDSAYVHRAWVKSDSRLKNIKFPMLSDRSGRFSSALFVYDKKNGTSIRASFIIDPDGTIVAAEYTDDSIGRNAGELLRKFDAAVAIRKGGGGLCPAGWKQGEETIKGE